MGNTLSKLKCVKKTRTKMYCVRDREYKRFFEAVELLDLLNKKIIKLISVLKKKHPKDNRVLRLKERYNPTLLKEVLPSSEHIAYVRDKGDEYAMCLQMERLESKFVDINTLAFVALHEISHIASVSVGHNAEFSKNFKFILENAVIARIYLPIDYRINPVRYCGMTITHNPYFE